MIHGSSKGNKVESTRLSSTEYMVSFLTGLQPTVPQERCFLCQGTERQPISAATHCLQSERRMAAGHVNDAALPLVVYSPANQRNWVSLYSDAVLTEVHSHPLYPKITTTHISLRILHQKDTNA